MSENRPELTSEITSGELLRWYWLKIELADLARSLGLSPTGSKQDLTRRIIARLDGKPTLVKLRRAPAASALPEPLSTDTRLPAGQRCTQQLRHYFVEAIGPTFRFDGAMRDFIATAEGLTLGDAVHHWCASRTREQTVIGPQFELNRFLRDWHQHHPAGSHTEALAAWRLHRDSPMRNH